MTHHMLIINRTGTGTGPGTGTGTGTHAAPSDRAQRDWPLPGEEKTSNVIIMVDEELELADGRRLVFCTAPHEPLGTGGEIWTASKALCRWQSSVAHTLRSARILELGSGTGICGLHAAALGASRVLLTDGVEALLDLARTNADRNRALYPEARVDVEAHCWGSSAPPAGQWDLVIGSELTYAASNCKALCKTVLQILSQAAEKPPRVVIAHHDRPVARGGMDGSLPELMAIATETGLTVTELYVDPQPSLDLGYPVSMVVLELGLLVTEEACEDVEELELPDGRRLVMHTLSHEIAGTGGVVWQSARALCRWQSSVAHTLRSARILELGSGTGICGLHAAALGASRVLLTDGVEALLDLARTNADRNRALYPEARVDVEAHCWGSSAPPAGQWDLVIGSDLTHLAHGSRLLCLTMRHLLERNACRVILAHQDRAVDGSLAEFVGIATESGMDVTELLVDRDSRGTYPPVPVAILELGLAQSKAAGRGAG